MLDLPNRPQRHIAGHIYSSLHHPISTLHHGLLAVVEGVGVQHQRLQHGGVRDAQQVAVAEGHGATLHRLQAWQHLQPDGDGREEARVAHAQGLQRSIVYASAQILSRTRDHTLRGVLEGIAFLRLAQHSHFTLL